MTNLNLDLDTIADDGPKIRISVPKGTDLFTLSPDLENSAGGIWASLFDPSKLCCGVRDVRVTASQHL